MTGKALAAVLLNSAALAALAGPAFAQSTANAAGPQVSQVEEIIVTANKREERLQDVPVSVSVVSGDQVSKQNIVEVTDLTRSVPSLNSAGPFGALSIRGVGSISFARSAEGSVGVVIDGVALANTSTNPPQLFDVARVEVLKARKARSLAATARPASSTSPRSRPIRPASPPLATRTSAHATATLPGAWSIYP